MKRNQIKKRHDNAKAIKNDDGKPVKAPILSNSFGSVRRFRFLSFIFMILLLIFIVLLASFSQQSEAKSEASMKMTKRESNKEFDDPSFSSLVTSPSSPKSTSISTSTTLSSPSSISLSCPYQELCSRTTPIKVAMQAHLHVASTTTDQTFAATTKAWNTSLTYTERGLVCPENKRPRIKAPGNCQASTINCVFDKLKYSMKFHANYDEMIKYKYGDITFTTLRTPESTAMAHYKRRNQTDWTYDHIYPNNTHNLTNVSVQEWTRKAWWRHNIFTKMMSTDTRLIFRHEDVRGPTKEQSHEQNALGEDSMWLSLAYERLKSFPFFGLFHRLEDSFELFGFHFCFPVNGTKQRLKEDKKPVDDSLKDILEEYFVLDYLLLEKAEIIFDELVADMRKKKEKGMLCDMRRVLNVLNISHNDEPGEFGIMCVDDEL